MPLANRATIGNMSPEYGSTVAIFPIDDETLRYLRLTGRPDEQVALVEAYAKEQGLWHDPDAEPAYSERLELDLSTVVPSLAGPKRPQDRVPARRRQDGVPGCAADYVRALRRRRRPRRRGRAPSRSRPATRRPTASTTRPTSRTTWSPPPPAPTAASPSRSASRLDGAEFELDHGAVVIAAITSCTNTSNPQVMLGAALLARRPSSRG